MCVGLSPGRGLPMLYALYTVLFTKFLTVITISLRACHVGRHLAATALFGFRNTNYCIFFT
jgi:hypothetical protein